MAHARMAPVAQSLRRQRLEPRQAAADVFHLDVFRLPQSNHRAGPWNLSERAIGSRPAVFAIAVGADFRGTLGDNVLRGQPLP